MGSQHPPELVPRASISVAENLQHARVSRVTAPKEWNIDWNTPIFLTSKNSERFTQVVIAQVLVMLVEWNSQMFQACSTERD